MYVINKIACQYVHVHARGFQYNLKYMAPGVSRVSDYLKEFFSCNLGDKSSQTTSLSAKKLTVFVSM